jgi:L-idonate 5-dehydrogenase
MRAIVAHAAKDLRIEDHETDALTESQVKVKIERGGICGSDLHYYNHGGFGTVRLREPMILGHEVAGTIAEVGSAVHHLKVGQTVAVSPSRPCGTCQYCLQGMPNHCMDMRFYGSAMPFPHIQGAFRETLVADAAQCAVTDNLTIAEAAMAEPLAVAVHATRQAGNLVGKRVLVTGCGPIGLLCILAARSAGAVNVVSTDLADFPLKTAEKIGADKAVNAKHNSALDSYCENKGHFDVLFECTGAAAALASAIPAIKPGGVIVQLGLGGDMTLPVQAMTAKEIQLRGSFRFHEEFFTGVEWMRSGQIDVKPLVTHTMPMSDATDAFELASDRSQALKVHLDFTA